MPGTGFLKMPVEPDQQQLVFCSPTAVKHAIMVQIGLHGQVPSLAGKKELFFVLAKLLFVQMYMIFPFEMIVQMA